MFFLKPLDFCRNFTNRLNKSIESVGGKPLSKAQLLWLSVCITGILMTNSVCWKKFERACLGGVVANTMSKMFRRANFFCQTLLKSSVMLILKDYNLNSGVLCLDDTDNKRSKNAKKIGKIHKVKDKSTGGFLNGQQIIFLLLVTDKITIPVGFEFYAPDPALSQWAKNNKKLKNQGIDKKNRPSKPQRSPYYLTKIELALRLLRDFKVDYPNVQIQATTADALYGSKKFMRGAAKIFPSGQVISQIRKVQKVKIGGKFISVQDYFKRTSSSKQNAVSQVKCNLVN